MENKENMQVSGSEGNGNNLNAIEIKRCTSGLVSFTY